MKVKAELVRDIEHYANQSSKNQEDVLEWVDTVLKEGIREVQIRYINYQPVQEEFFQHDEYISQYIGYPVLEMRMPR